MSNSVRILYCICGVLTLALGLVTLWLNVYGGFTRAPWLCDAGFCEAEAIGRAVVLTGLAGPIRPETPVDRLRQGLLRNDAASPYAWSEAAFHYQNAGNHAQARYCAGRAFQLGPGSAPLLMRILHFYLAENSREDVLRTGKAILALVRDFDDFVFRYYEETGSRTSDVLERGLPTVGESGASYIYNRMAAGDLAGATQTWTWLKSHSLASERVLDAYVGFLIRQKAIDASRQTWDEFHAKERGAYPGNLVYNPEFELPPSQGPYDWKLAEVAGATIEIDRSARQGKPALKIDFRGEDNIEFAHVSQAVPVTRRPLRLKVWVKCEALTTNEGIAVRVADQESPNRFSFTTEQLTGTADWKLWDCALAVPPETQLLDVRVIRHRSQKFDNKIRGSVWFSGFSIEPAAR